jgi:hypothetical protein
MSNQIIKRVNQIGMQERQGQLFCFLNQQGQGEPYEWMDEVPEHDPEFKGFLKEEEVAPYPDISAELPGVELESEEANFTGVTEEPEPDF